MEKLYPTKPTLFLDFDGVICDSINECFVSSWLAYYGMEDTQPDRVSLEYHNRFAALRPFIRTGSDYVFIHEVLASGRTVTGQADFDDLLEAGGEEKQRRYHEVFYETRENLLESEREYWLALNRIYDGVSDWLSVIQDHSYVVTTKKAAFAAEILSANGSSWDEERIFCSGKQRKIPFIRRIMDEHGILRAAFVDDQIDHLNKERDPAINVYLAEWGYVQPAWLKQSTVPILTKDDFLGLLRRLF